MCNTITFGYLLLTYISWFCKNYFYFTKLYVIVKLTHILLFVLTITLHNCITFYVCYLLQICKLTLETIGIAFLETIGVAFEVAFGIFYGATGNYYKN